MGFLSFVNENRTLNESIHDKGLFKAVFLTGVPGCFDGNTLVRTLHGYVPIKDVKIGDLVYTKNEITNETELKSVDDVLCYDETNEDVLEIEFDNGETVICTENHEFFIDGKWIKAKDL
jgi:intein/homing endonuclease